jgi:hypothetical protein
MIEINEHILEEARALLEQPNIKLPAPICEFPGLWLASGNDRTVHAVAALLYNGAYYKVGFPRLPRHDKP